VAVHDYVISNGTGAAVRSDLNGALAAIVSQNSSATEPSPTYAYQRWADTTAGVMKMRNGANSAWITLYQLDGEWSTIAFENGTAAAPSIYFKDSGTDTGIYSPGADQVAISTGGTGRLFVTSAGLVGVGTAGPTGNLHVVGVSGTTIIRAVGADSEGNADAEIFSTGSAGNSRLYFSDTAAQSGSIIYNHNTNSFAFATAGTSRIVVDGSGNVNIDSGTFYVDAANNRVGIGTTGPSSALHVVGTTTLNGTQSFTANSTTGSYATFQHNGTIVGDIGTANQAISSGSNTDFAISTRAATSIVFGINTAEKARIDSSGRLLVGTSSSLGFAAGQAEQKFQIAGSTDGGLAIGSFGADAFASNLDFFKSRSGTIGTKTIVQSGDFLGKIFFSGADGTNFIAGASIEAFVDGTPGTSDMPGRLVFSTTADGASSPTERLRITNGGNPVFKWPSVARAQFNHTSSTAADNYGLEVRYQGVPNGTGNEFLYCADNDGATIRATIRSNGGLANFSANNANLSDRNAKKDISLAADTWNCVKEWEIVNYRYKDQPDDADLNLGVVAQQVAESCPEVITVFEEAKDDQPEKLGVKEQQMYWMAIKALQEAQVRIEQLEAKVAALEGV
jgi:hypothetical protein